jgi:hypothetical protein
MVQASVEWLYYAMQKTPMTDWYKVLEQAKERHKEETMDAFQAGKFDWSIHIDHGKNSMDPAEYYNETFKK